MVKDGALWVDPAIARILDVTTHTAKAHVCNIIQKLSVDDRTQVAVKALPDGLIPGRT